MASDASDEGFLGELARALRETRQEVHIGRQDVRPTKEARDVAHDDRVDSRSSSAMRTCLASRAPLKSRFPSSPSPHQ